MEGSSHRRRVARVLVPGQLIFYRNNALRASRDIPGAPGVITRLHYPTQQYLAVIAIDHNRGILSDSIVSQRALDLGYQKGVVGAVSRGLVMMMPLEVDAVMG